MPDSPFSIFMDENLFLIRATVSTLLGISLCYSNSKFSSWIPTSCSTARKYSNILESRNCKFKIYLSLAGLVVSQRKKLKRISLRYGGLPRRKCVLHIVRTIINDCWLLLRLMGAIGSIHKEFSVVTFSRPA